MHPVVTPVQTVEHTIAVNDDFNQNKAICSCGTLIYEGDDRNEKMACCHDHLADVFRGLT